MTWHRTAVVTAVVLSLTTAAFAADPPPTPAAKWEAIQKDVKDAQAAFYKAVQTLPEDSPESQKKSQELYKEFDKKQADGFMAAVELAKTDPKSETAFAALEWVLTAPRAYYLPAGKAGLEMATEQYSANPKIGKTVAWVGYYFPRGQGAAEDEAAAFIRAVAAKNPDRDARGQAVMGLAGLADAKFAVAEYKKSPDTEALAAEAEKAFEAVIKDYGDCPRLIAKNAGTLGERAKQALFELQHLRVGKLAPEIEGEDLDGKKFKLSDYRGKVVMLDFWGNW